MNGNQASTQYSKKGLTTTLYRRMKTDFPHELVNLSLKSLRTLLGASLHHFAHLKSAEIVNKLSRTERKCPVFTRNCQSVRGRSEQVTINLIQ